MKTMMMVVAAFSFLAGGNLWANPIATESLRIRQVPTSTHLQISWSVMTSGTGKPKVNEIKRDGAVLQGTWHDLASFTANTGSGLVSNPATQFCDCDVTVGPHTYVIKAVGFGGTHETSTTMTFTVEANLPQPHDAGVPGGDAMPWELPEPTEIQGLNCLAECKAAADGGIEAKDAAIVVKDAGVVIQKDAGVVTRKDASVVTRPDAIGINPLKDKEDDGGCSITSTRPLTGSFFFLLALSFLAIRRRQG